MQPVNKKLTDDVLRRIIETRHQFALETGRELPWNTIAEQFDVSARRLRDVRRSARWAKLLEETGAPVEAEAATAARRRLLELMYSRNENIALGAAQTVVKLMLGHRMELAAVRGNVNVLNLNLSGVSSEDLRRVAGELAEAEGVAPGTPDPRAIDARLDALEVEDD